MSVKSMTGFARAAGVWEGTLFHWELRSVNGRGLDVRMRLPPGHDALEPQIRALVSKRVARGSVTVVLQLDQASEASSVRVNEQALAVVIEAVERLANRRGFDRPRPEGVLALRGVVEAGNRANDAENETQRLAAMVAALETGLSDLVVAREQEGARLAAVIARGLEQVHELSEAMGAHPSRRPEAIKERLVEQLRRLLDNASGLDEGRLHQEAALLATRSDIEEELKRLASHVASGRQLLREESPVGRKFDFLAQELNREANTICSKSSDIEVTQLGLELKAVIDQVREQVQNIE